MYCIDCPYTEVVRDEDMFPHTVCRFSLSRLFLSEVRIGDSCSLDAEIRECVYSDTDIYGHCVNCKHFSDGWEDTDEECETCFCNGGEEDNWEWEGDNT